MSETQTFFLFKLITAMVIGGVLGSFFTMLVHRVPRKLSIVAPRSHCPTCKQTLGVRDLVPVFSYLWNKGTCRFCSTPIPLRYLMIELAFVLSAAGFAFFI
jgi:prepilin signal peptidase PulO-like enzyme (type II secretory pathway)